MTPREFKYVFGPVPSRRLGRSMGVDLVPFKTCTYDCIYCQLGRTTCQTAERREYVPVEEVVDELRRRLHEQPVVDYITLSGSGEPTLHSRIGEVISAVKDMTQTPVAVLTNGSLLHEPDVRKSLMQADVVLPSLDAGDPWMFDYVNRARETVAFDEMVEGLATFRQCFKSQIWLEVFLLDGVTSVEPEARKIAQWVKRIAPDRVQLNTVARPPVEEYAFSVPQNVLDRLASLFEPVAEVIAEFRSVPSSQRDTVRVEDVLALLSRRPCIIADVARGLGLHVAEAIKYLEALLSEGRCEEITQEGKRFFRPLPLQGSSRR